MNKSVISAVLFLAIALSVISAAQAASTADTYDRKADGTAQIREALKRAQAENKHVLLDFGSDTYSWCRKLHDLFTQNAAVSKQLRDNFILVLIDVSKVDGKLHNRDVDETYGNPTRLGLPVLVVLDTDGTPLTTQEMGSLEENDHYSALKLVTFLAKWKPARQAS